MRIVCVATVAAALALTADAQARGSHGLRIAPGPCSVFSHHPCAPVCSVFGHGPCIPDVLPPIGQDLRLTVESRRAGEYAMPDHDLDTIADLFAALRACWKPPADPREGLAMSVRFAFKRTGEVIAPPRITYVNRAFPEPERDAFRDTVMAGFDACAPLHFTSGLAGAIAGRPIAIRYIDNRDAGSPPRP